MINFSVQLLVEHFYAYFFFLFVLGIDMGGYFVYLGKSCSYKNLPILSLQTQLHHHLLILLMMNKCIDDKVIVFTDKVLPKN